jgi:hypothetical protein
MKKMYFFLLLCLTTYIGLSQVQSDCELKPENKFYYKRDVADLTMQRLFSTGSHDTQIVIPDVYQDSIWRGLAAILMLCQFLKGIPFLIYIAYKMLLSNQIC